MPRARLSKTQVDRLNWITYLWEGGRSARTDVAKRAKTLYMRDQYSEWLPQKNTSDIENLDVPRDNILPVNVYGKTIWFGATQVQTAKKTAKLGSRVLASNFSSSEIRNMRNVYVDLGGTNNQRFAGMTCFFHQGIAVLVQKGYLQDAGRFESVLTHEFIHVRRSFSNERVLDKDEEEKKTELERIARVKNPLKGITGYYQYASSPSESIKKDRTGITGGLNRKIKGAVAVRKTKEYYPKSEIRKVHFSPPEKIDRYFDVSAPTGHYSIHIWYPKAPDNRKVNYDLKSIFGNEARIYEWSDGKRVRLN